MAGVVNFISGLAALQIESSHRRPLGRCDYCSAPATQRIQGETDLWGCEMLDACAEHARWIREGLRFTECVKCDTNFVIPHEPDYSRPYSEQQEQFTCPSCIAGSRASAG